MYNSPGTRSSAANDACNHWPQRIFLQEPRAAMPLEEVSQTSHGGKWRGPGVARSGPSESELGSELKRGTDKT